MFRARPQTISALFAVACWLMGTVAFGDQPPAQPPAKNAAGTQQQPAKQAPAAPGKQEMAPAKTGTAPARAPGETKERLITYTYDGVKIEGVFYPPLDDKGRKTPVIMLLHAVGPRALNASHKDFDKLPEKLQKLGFAVVTFDFRGYGDSKALNMSEFLRYNQVRNKKNPERLEAKDYTSATDLLSLVNDLVAVKTWINKKNNSGDCNSNLVGVVAVEQSAVVATAWIANELTDANRSKDKKTASNVFIPGVGTVQNVPANPAAGSSFGTGTSGTNPGLSRMEGDDIACLVAVSSSNRLNEAIPMQIIENWLVLLRDKHVATVGLYGGNDHEASSFWNKASAWIKPPRDAARYKNSGVKQIKNTSLVGTKLLLNDTLDVAKWLEDYLNEAVKKAGEAKIWTEQPGTELPSQVDISRLLR
jgi:hypothetical protein